VLPVATDGAFFPDGRHLVVRSYTSAVVYAWPSLQPVGSFRLPRQRQGEGIAVAGDGRVYLSSEGRRSPLLELTLPPRIASVVRPQTTAGPAPPSPSPGTAGSVSPPETDPASHDAWPWLAGGLIGVAAIVVLLRALKPH
jgi:hypothetical protein